MKKIICMVVICVLVLGLPPPGLRQGETFEIPDLHDDGDDSRRGGG